MKKTDQTLHKCILEHAKETQNNTNTVCIIYKHVQEVENQLHHHHTNGSPSWRNEVAQSDKHSNAPCNTNEIETKETNA